MRSGQRVGQFEYVLEAGQLAIRGPRWDLWID
jgi:hypothetical protein